MSMPVIPPMSPPPHIPLSDAISLILVSIALEEIGLSHIINAEGEKIQRAIQLSENIPQLILVNNSVSQTLRTIIKKEVLLELKMVEALEALRPLG
ncbi:hypothetical protein [Paenibacillus thalictri]|uniref:Uncharacterized protein n=1 Tax=Paenibacillus thalictri TaxID=2527873 RepID=A0A4Q9DKI6_9BACL|nr:hypothetical protein [Paenibacillus thalictri]TBL75293.1 hypothetical protein EYB31_23045 [Paenibacillus thalictri]